MWTKQHRKTYGRVGGRYPSDMMEGEWACLEPMIPPAKPGGRPREINMREAVTAIFYVLRAGCPWRYLPRDGFSPRSTVCKRRHSSADRPAARSAGVRV
ncbi:MAG: transposase [Methylocella sp.]